MPRTTENDVETVLVWGLKIARVGRYLEKSVAS